MVAVATSVFTEGRTAVTVYSDEHSTIGQTWEHLGYITLRRDVNLSPMLDGIYFWTGLLSIYSYIHI